MSSRFFVFLFAFLLTSPLCHAEAVVVGEKCSQLGASVMASDQTSIAVCVKETAGSANLIWKAMSTSSSGGGTICGLGLGMTSTNNPDKAVHQKTTHSYGSVAKCEGRDILTATGASNCPSGYTLKGMQASYLPSSAHASTGHSSVTIYHYFCVAD